MRILTRGDLDGLTSSVLLSMAEKITEIRFAHPKDVQDGKVPCTEEDIVVNLPFVPGCGLWFDHHVSEETKAEHLGNFRGRFEVAPSAARVVFNYYKKPEFDRFKELLESTDALDSATLAPEDVQNPQRWILLGYTLDPRTGLGPEFQKYFRWLVEYVKEVPIEKILQHPEVAKRVKRVRDEQQGYAKFLSSHCKLDGTVVITDLRGVKNVPVGNRFLVYSLFPSSNVEMRILSGHQGQTVIAAGHSIFNRTCPVNIGKLCAEYGGGGHKGAGTCQLAAEGAEEGVKAFLARLKAGSPQPEPAAKPAKAAKPKAKAKAKPKAKPKAKKTKPKAKKK
jgi:hypothetical protein